MKCSEHETFNRKGFRAHLVEQCRLLEEVSCLLWVKLRLIQNVSALQIGHRKPRQRER